MNTRQIGVITQQLANPPIHPQQPEISNGSGESRLLSTFHSTVSNDPPSTPPAPALALVWMILDANIHQSEDEFSSATSRTSGGTRAFSKLLARFSMKCNFLLILNMFIAIFTWQNNSSFGLVVPTSLEFHRQLVSQESNRGFFTLSYIFCGKLLLFFNI
jgi:hypothetical protein